MRCARRWRRGSRLGSKHVIAPPWSAAWLQSIHHVLICDRDRKWSLAVRELLETSGVRVIQTPFRAPNCNAHAERFVRSVKEECLDRRIPLGERHFRRALADFVVLYHRERNHQGLGNELIDGMEVQSQMIAPGVGTPAKGGLDYREAHMVTEMLADSGLLRAPRSRRGQSHPRRSQHDRRARRGTGRLRPGAEDHLTEPTPLSSYNVRVLTGRRAVQVASRYSPRLNEPDIVSPLTVPVNR